MDDFFSYDRSKSYSGFHISQIITFEVTGKTVSCGVGLEMQELKNENFKNN